MEKIVINNEILETNLTEKELFEFSITKTLFNPVKSLLTLFLNFSASLNASFIIFAIPVLSLTELYFFILFKKLISIFFPPFFANNYCISFLNKL